MKRNLLPIVSSLVLLATPALSQSDEPEDSWTEPVSGVKFLHIPGGTFVMGSPSTEERRQQFAETEHPVSVGTFWLAETEVAQAQWKAVMGANPANFKGDDLPVEKVSWYELQKFIQKLNSRTGGQSRLPTEAEWEYAARTGTMTVRYWGGGRCEPGQLQRLWQRLGLPADGAGEKLCPQRFWAL